MTRSTPPRRQWRKAWCRAAARPTSEGGEALGLSIVRRALEEPTRQLAANAGAEGSLIVERLKRGDGRMGYEVLSGEFTAMVKAGGGGPPPDARPAPQDPAG